MNYLGYTEDDLLKRGAFHTGREIALQPSLWMNIYNRVNQERDALKNYLDQALSGVSKVILTGAGSSAFIGRSLKGSFRRLLNVHTIDVPTTDLVSHPLDYLSDSETILLVSFARSGNSPESIAAVSLADKLCKKCFHLIITCDGKGELANYQTHSPKFVFILPEESNDQSLAMTGSYSGMLLTGLLLTRIGNWDAMEGIVNNLSGYGSRILTAFAPMLNKVASMPFERAVFLGSGPFLGTATESHLKLQELTDGSIICKEDSYLGFRHGPKAVINGHSLVVFILSNDPYVHRYEADLIQSMNRGKKALYTIGIAESPVHDLHFDLSVEMSDAGRQLDEDMLTVPSILPAQLLGFYKSLSLGLMPDAPSVSGAISRVVEGVKIYPF